MAQGRVPSPICVKHPLSYRFFSKLKNNKNPTWIFNFSATNHPIELNQTAFQSYSKTVHAPYSIIPKFNLPVSRFQKKLKLQNEISWKFSQILKNSPTFVTALVSRLEIDAPVISRSVKRAYRRSVVAESVAYGTLVVISPGVHLAALVERGAKGIYCTIAEHTKERERERERERQENSSVRELVCVLVLLLLLLLIRWLPHKTEAAVPSKSACNRLCSNTEKLQCIGGSVSIYIWTGRAPRPYTPVLYMRIFSWTWSSFSILSFPRFFFFFFYSLM